MKICFKKRNNETKLRKQKQHGQKQVKIVSPGGSQTPEHKRVRSTRYLTNIKQ